MKTLKNILRNSKFIVNVYEAFFQRPIFNYFGTKHIRKVLFSYSTYHFKKSNYISHSNYQESIITAKIFDELGYTVDVINNNRLTSLPLEEYDIIFGEGLPIFQAVEKKVPGKVIYYATGSHPWQCTAASLNRLCEFQHRYAIAPLASTRIQDYRWGIAASLADAVICIGNSTTRTTFEQYGVQNIHLVRPTFHPEPADSVSAIQRDVASTRKTALWFGSYGLLHKGLDLAIEAFRERQDWTLHVCGHTEREHQLLNVIDIPSNVHIHGFINISSPKFRDIVSRTHFVILPSCSEGIATSIITAMGRGAMIPLVTAACGVDIDNFGIKIKELNSESIIATLNECDMLSDVALADMSKQACHTAYNDYSAKQYREKMRENILAILRK